jgi:hypothetical protein
MLGIHRNLWDGDSTRNRYTGAELVLEIGIEECGDRIRNRNIRRRNRIDEYNGQRQF